MKAEESKLSKILVDSRIYEIPSYQRPYSWSEKHCQELITDIYDAFENKEQEYFIGSIITIEKQRDTLFEVVDGQQRLTTLNLILSKLRDLIESSDAKQEVQKRIMPINVLTGETEKPRLIVREQDQRFFLNYVLNSNKLNDNFHLTEVQQRFVNNLVEIEKFFEDKNQVTLKHFANFLLDKVYVVFVTTDNFNSAYRMFNVLNARGLTLSNSDLIKNKLFILSQNKEDVKEIVEETWYELEELLGIENIDLFLSHYRTSFKGNKQQDNLFKEYDNFLSSENINVSDFCQKLLESARNYQKIRKNEFVNLKAKRLIISLNNVTYDEWIPALLCFLNNQDPGVQLGITDTVFIEYLEKITMQNWIRRLGRTQRNTVYYNLINCIIVERKQNKEIKLKADAIINTFCKYSNNEEIETYLRGDLYGMSYALAVLMRLEQELQDESVTKIYDGKISIEHILPQSLVDNYWQSRFPIELHRHWLHKIGNLALLSGRKNSAAQNYDFDRKKQIYERNGQQVSFDLTKQILSSSDWTESELSTRQELLVKKAVSIWSL